LNLELEVREITGLKERYFLRTPIIVGTVRSDGSDENRRGEASVSNSVHVVLQGTTCAANILTDIQYRKVWHQGLDMNIHNGFGKVPNCSLEPPN